MNKLLLVVSVILLALLSSCNKTNEIKEDVKIIEQQTITDIPEGTKFIDVTTPDGEVVKLEVPENFEYQQQTSESASSRCGGGSNDCIVDPGLPCNSSLMFYAIPRNTETCQFNWFRISVGPDGFDAQGNQNQPTCSDPAVASRCTTIVANFGVSHFTSGIDHESNDAVQLEFADFQPGGNCINFLLLIAHWTCNGVAWTFYDVCANSPFINHRIGRITSCFDKCGFNSEPLPLPACTNCSNQTITCP